MTTARPAKRDSYHHGDLRRALLDAAGALLEEQGSGALSLRAAARRSGVSQTAPYRHFPDKQALLAALGAEGFDWLCQRLEAACADSGAGRDRIVALGIAYVGFALKHPARFRLMFSAEIPNKDDHPELAAAVDRTYELVRGCVGVVSADGVSADVRTFGHWAMAHGAAMLLLEGKVRNVGDSYAERKAAVEAILKMYADGMAAQD